MAFWTLIISASFIFLLIVIGDYQTISPAAVTLMGISAATGLGATLINQSDGVATNDKWKDVQAFRSRRDLERQLVVAHYELKQIEELSNPSTPVSVGAATSQMSPALLAERKAKLENFIAMAESCREYYGFFPAIKSFVLDLLEERDTVNFHRFQLAVWSTILGVVFVYNVAEELAMPDFSASLLILVGISSGTYIGFKAPAAKAANPG